MSAIRRRLTEEEREAIRALYNARPDLTYKRIGAKFGVSDATISNVINFKHSAKHQRPQPDQPKVVMRLPACTQPQEKSTLRPIPLSALMAGNARVCRHTA